MASKQQGTLTGFVGGSNAPPTSKDFQVPFTKTPISCLRTSTNQTTPPSLIFTHGAGGTLSAPGMVNFSSGFATSSPIVSFQGPMNLKSRTTMFLTVIKHQKSGKALGGRSMGARAAVLAAQETPETMAVVLASYPLVNEKGDVRDQILLDLRAEVDVLFISGDQDNMMDFERLKSLRTQMKAKSWLVVVEGADHGMTMKPKKATDKIGNLTGSVAAKWLKERDEKKTEATITWNEASNKAICSDWMEGEPSETVDEVQDEEENAPRKRRKVTKK